MDLFGFEEDLEQNSEIAPSRTALKPVPKEVSMNDDKSKLTISQIQDLLSKDLDNDTVSDQDTFQESETSIFEDITPCLPELRNLRPHRRRVAEESVQKTNSLCSENTAESEFVVPVIRAYQKPGRRKKVLGAIENTHVDETTNSSSSKPKKHIRKKGKTNKTNKAKAKNDENEKVDIIAEKINHQFREVEQYRLVVE